MILPDVRAREDALVQLRSLVSEHRGALSEARGALSAVDREIQMRVQRLQAIAQEKKAWSERSQGAAERIQALEERLQQTRLERGQLDEAPVQFAAQRRALNSELEEAEALRRQARTLWLRPKTSLRKPTVQRARLWRPWVLVREEAARASERGESAKRRREDIAREIAEALDCAPEQTLDDC